MPEVRMRRYEFKGRKAHSQWRRRIERCQDLGTAVVDQALLSREVG